MKNLVRNNWASFLVILMAAVWAFSQSHVLPDQIPLHFDLNGNADRYGDKFYALVLMPALNLFVVLLLAVFTKVSPKGYEMPNSQKLIGLFNLGLTLFLMAIYVGMIYEAQAPKSGQFAKFVIPGLALFMIFIGNYFGKLERNFLIGIRLPWTLASEDNWRRTHRFAGKAFVVAGILALILSFVGLELWVAFSMLILASLCSVVYSVSYYFRYERV